MSKVLLGAALGLFVAGQAMAADMPRPARVVPAATPEFSWAGWYFGSNSGGSWGKTDVTYSTPFATIAPDNHLNGFVNGVQIGYNWQAGSWVYGLEADGDFRHNTKTLPLFLFPGTVPATAGLPFGSVTGDNTLIKTQQNSFGTFRGRIGYASSNWLYYATGGLAYGNVKQSETETLVAPNAASFRTFTHSHNQLGWAAGGGVQVGFGSNWSASVEYLYVDLGKSSIAQAASTNLVVFPADATTFHDTSHTLRLKMNYALGVR